MMAAAMLHTRSLLCMLAVLCCSMHANSLLSTVATVAAANVLVYLLLVGGHSPGTHCWASCHQEEVLYDYSIQQVEA